MLIFLLIWSTVDFLGSFELLVDFCPVGFFVAELLAVGFLVVDFVTAGSFVVDIVSDSKAVDFFVAEMVVDSKISHILVFYYTASTPF